MSTRYERVADLVSRVRNARFADIVTHVDELIDSQLWRDFTTPVGTRFEFRAKEFDYFLAAQEVDPTMVRTAYIKADGVDGLAAKEMRLADITGKGVTPNGDRRPYAEVAKAYAADPSGAGARIKAWGERGFAVVTDRAARIARDPKRRKAFVTGKEANRERPNSKTWRVRWSDDRPVAQVIADQLLTTPELAHEVYKLLHAARESDRYHHQKRRSEGQSVDNGGRQDRSD